MTTVMDYVVVKMNNALFLSSVGSDLTLTAVIGHVRAKNAQPTQELDPFSVGQTAVSADVGRWREIGDICRVI